MFNCCKFSVCESLLWVLSHFPPSSYNVNFSTTKLANDYVWSTAWSGIPQNVQNTALFPSCVWTCTPPWVWICAEKQEWADHFKEMTFALKLDMKTTRMLFTEPPWTPTWIPIAVERHRVRPEAPSEGPLQGPFEVPTTLRTVSVAPARDSVSELVVLLLLSNGAENLQLFARTSEFHRCRFLVPFAACKPY